MRKHAYEYTDIKDTSHIFVPNYLSVNEDPNNEQSFTMQLNPVFKDYKILKHELYYDENPLLTHYGKFGFDDNQTYSNMNLVYDEFTRLTHIKPIFETLKHPLGQDKTHDIRLNINPQKTTYKKRDAKLKILEPPLYSKIKLLIC